MTRGLGYDLKGALQRVLGAPHDGTRFAADVQRCGAALARPGSEIAEIGKTLEAPSRGTPAD